MTLRQYLDVLRARWRIVVAALLLGLAIGAAVTALVPRRYSADAVILISTQPGIDIALAVQGADLSGQRMTTYAEILRSAKIAQEVASDPVVGLPVADVMDKISVSTVTGTTLLTATVTDSAPDRAAQIANLVAAKFTATIAQLEQPADPLASPLIEAQVFAPATPNPVAVSPSQMLNLAAGAALGLIAGFGIAIVRDSFDTRVRTRRELGNLIDVPVLGVIGYDPKIRKSPLVVFGNPNGQPAEAFRQVRTNVRFVDADRVHKIILVASPSTAEGRTVTVCNLAAALAEADVSVLIVDADLRRPAVAATMGVDGSVGLANVLVDGTPVAEVILPVGPGLDVLASGPVPPNPSELLGSDRMADLLEHVRSTYDLVLVDSSPLLPVTDAAVLALRADGVLLVVRHGRTTAAQVRAAWDSLDAVSARVLGSVLTMVPKLGRQRHTTSGPTTGRGHTAAAVSGGAPQPTDQAENTEITVATGAEEITETTAEKFTNGAPRPSPVSYTHLTLPTTPYV